MTESTTETEQVEERETVQDVQLNRCDVAFLLNVHNVQTLAEALDLAAANLGHNGLRSFYVLATDPETGRQWVIQDGEIVDPDLLKPEDE